MEFITYDFVTSGSKVIWSQLIVHNESINDMDSFSKSLLARWIYLDSIEIVKARMHFEECIPVGCVPTACWPSGFYCSRWGCIHAAAGGCMPRGVHQGGASRGVHPGGTSRGVYPVGVPPCCSKGVHPGCTLSPLCGQNDRRLWKHFLRRFATQCIV